MGLSLNICGGITGLTGLPKGLSILGLGIRSGLRPVRPEDAPAGEAALEKIKKL